jgi:uncharacterized protein
VTVDLAERLTRRRRVVAGFTVAGTGLLGLSFSTRPASLPFYASTLGVAGTWLLGGLAAGTVDRGGPVDEPGADRRPVLGPILTGAGAFGVFYAGALCVRRVGRLDTALRAVLRFADQGSGPLVLLTTLANGAAEEVFFRGALYETVRDEHAVAVTTAVYTVTTLATRNPALVLAAGVMGSLFGLQRRTSGGIQAPLLTHLTWASLMIRYLPPLFPSPEV